MSEELVYSSACQYFSYCSKKEWRGRGQVGKDGGLREASIWKKKGEMITEMTSRQFDLVAWLDTETLIFKPSHSHF